MSTQQPQNQQNFYLPGPTKAVAITDLGMASVQVIGENRNRKQLIFHNPNPANNIAVCPAQDTDGNALAAAFDGGSIVIIGYSTFIITGECTNAWKAIGDATSLGLTIWES